MTISVYCDKVFDFPQCFLSFVTDRIVCYARRRSDAGASGSRAQLNVGDIALHFSLVTMPTMAVGTIAAFRERGDQIQTPQTGPLPWRPVSNHISIPREPPKHGDEKALRNRRDNFADSAHQRYEEWTKQQPAHSNSGARVASHHFPVFRDRTKSLEHAGEWSSADRVLPERVRIERAVYAATAAFLQNPPYPKQGGGVKNVEFSYMNSG